MEHTLIVAGIGPGDPDYILPKAQKAIEGARYLVGGRRALSDYAKPSQETYPVTGKLSLLADWLEEALKKDDVVVMVSGDPGYYSLLPWLKKRFPEHPNRERSFRRWTARTACGSCLQRPGPGWSRP